MEVDELLEMGFKEISFAPDYLASNCGLVYSMKMYRGERGRYLKQTIKPDGYPVVSLMINGKAKTISVHLIIADAFLPPKKNAEHQIRHLDGNKLNNRAENLSWGTSQENINDRTNHGTTARGSRHGQAKLSDIKVKRIKTLIATGARNADIAREYGVHDSCISQIRRGLWWRHII